MCFPIVLWTTHIRQSQKNKAIAKCLFQIAVSVLFLLSMWATASWGGTITIIISIGIYVFYHMRNSLFRIGVSASLVILLVCIGFTVYPETQRQILNSSAEGRPQLFMKSFIVIAKRPLLGWGWANVDHAFSSVDWQYPYNPDTYIDKAHSHVLETLITTGFIGFCAYLSVWYVLFSVIYRTKNKDTRFFLFLFFLTYGIYTQTNVTSIATEVLWFVFLAYVAVLEEKKNEKNMV